MNLGQIFFTLLPVCYLTYLILVSYQRSAQRQSVFSSTLFQDNSQVEATSAEDSKFQLQDFHRMEIKMGKTVWEIRAKDAKFYPAESTTHVNELKLTVFRPGQSEVIVTSNVARLLLSGNSFRIANLEGNVVVATENDTKIITEKADYDAEAKKFNAPGFAQIRGLGFLVEGVDLNYSLETEIASFSKSVNSEFSSSAQIPDKLMNSSTN